LHLGKELYGPNQISTRRFYSLVKWLPPEAAVWRSMQRNWTTENELQAITIEMLDGFRRLYLQANSKKGTQLPPPITIPRPWDKKKEPSKRSGTTLKEMIGIMKVPVRRGDK
jgi:hypothetical protein